jgi:transglutaminase-like putative cysteine protease
MLLHADRAPLWCLVVAVVALTWRGLHGMQRVPLPGTVVRMMLTVLLVLTIVAFYHTVSGLAAGSALLLVMGAAKLLETRTRRDAVVISMVTLVMLLAACLDRQSLLRVPLYMACGWLAIAALAALGSRPASRTMRSALTIAGKSLLYALPLALLSFVLVPRMSGALWSVPGAEQAQTGLGDEMSPGSISELSISDAIAFRVRFTGAPPQPQERYWRGPVLHDFDGYTWRRRLGQIALRQPVSPASAPLRYQIMLEPHGRDYLFGLDHVRAIEGRRYFVTFDDQFVATRPVTTPVTYEATSYLRVRSLAPLSRLGRRLDTQLPAGRNPRSFALAQSLRARATSDRQYTQMVLEYFRAAGFEYTLTPPRLDYDSVDDLIFRTRLGFCGHFASAYVTLMRAAGIPARVVTGYQGGEWNAVGGYYLVRQSAAHAWAEVWLDDSGWVRIDPTAVVAPERLRRGLRDLLPDSGSTADRLLRSSAWMRDLFDHWDAASAWWQERVVNFNLAQQVDLLQWLGLPDPDYRDMVLLLACGAGLWVALLWWTTARARAAAGGDPLRRLWNRYARLLKAQGIPLATFDAPRAIATRATERMPAAGPALALFTERYLQLRYATNQAPSAGALKSLRAALREVARATAAHRPR